jgi:hypothetical protein
MLRGRAERAPALAEFAHCESEPTLGIALAGRPTRGLRQLERDAPICIREQRSRGCVERDTRPMANAD